MITMRNRYLNQFVTYGSYHGKNKSPPYHKGDPVHLIPEPCCSEMSLPSLKRIDSASSKFFRANLQLPFGKHMLSQDASCPHMNHIGGHHNTPKLEYVSLEECPEEMQLTVQGREWYCNLVSIYRCTLRPRKSWIIVTGSQNII